MPDCEGNELCDAAEGANETAMMTSHVGSPHDQSDVPLLARMRSGDTGALDLLLEQYWAPLVTYSGRLLNSHDMAEDVVQEAFIRLWEHRERWSLEGSVRALLYKITRME